MSRLSREKKREQQRATWPAEPVDVRVSGTGGALVAGVPVVAGPGEEIQHAVLNHLHRIVLANGHPVLASVHDDRIGYVVPLRIDADGSSCFAGEPVRMAPPAEWGDRAEREEREAREAPEGQGEPVGDGLPVTVAGPTPHRDKPTHLLHQVPEPVRDAVPTFPLRAVPESEVPETPVTPVLREPASGETAPTFTLRAVEGAPLGTVQTPTGVFGPPPVMGAEPAPVAEPEPKPEPVFDPEPVLDPDPKPTPARGFDAVAEEVLGDGPVTTTEEGAALLTEPMTRINEAVKAGRIETAAALAQRTVAEASALLGHDHPEVLHLRELTAYIAYLAGDPLRSFRLSIDLSRMRRHTGDAEGAYGNVQSAASAWRAVRDPEQGLSLGRELIALWTELAAEGGPAAEDVEQLHSAHSRMGRLTERARRAANP